MNKPVDALRGAVELLRTRALGRHLTNFQVLGVNSLKTLFVTEGLAGQRFLEVREVEGLLEWRLSDHLVRIDLQRTGQVVWRSETHLWEPGAPSMPTVRVVLGSDGFDVTEPGKTKRVAVWIEPLRADR